MVPPCNHRLSSNTAGHNSRPHHQRSVKARTNLGLLRRRKQGYLMPLELFQPMSIPMTRRVSIQFPVVSTGTPSTRRRSPLYPAMACQPWRHPLCLTTATCRLNNREVLSLPPHTRTTLVTKQVRRWAPLWASHPTVMADTI